MSAGRRTRRHEATREEIKQWAHHFMREQGVSALSLHAIARAMGLTGPALYRYFASRDDLVTALIVDVYQAQADALAAASESAPATDPIGQLLAVILAYRTWALAHAVDYALLAGHPVPGYVPPREIIADSARRGMDLLISLVRAALQSGAYTPPAIALPLALEPMLEMLRQERGYDVSLSVMYLVLVGWEQAQGFVLQEVFHHLQPLISDPETLYQSEAHAWLRRLGLPSPAL
jgi:AcrR family transcriptional regulator